MNPWYVYKRHIPRIFFLSIPLCFETNQSYPPLPQIPLKGLKGKNSGKSCVELHLLLTREALY